MSARPPYETARVDELEREDGWSPIRRQLDVQAFGINAWTTHKAGAVVIPDHDEQPSRHEELYIVTAGHASFTVDGQEIDAPTGTIVFVRDPATRRGAVARHGGTTIVAVGGEAGAAYRPRAWETNADVLALFDDGMYAEAKRLLSTSLDLYEDRGSLFYNLACAEAQLGETEEALEHLGAALRERPSLGEDARRDADFEPIRHDPRFTELVGSG